jgi:type IV pilus assembly protein PilV
MKLRSQQGGFSLLEVLVSVFVLAIGLLGLASLQAFSIKGSKGSEHRAQAILIAEDMMERMRSNRAAALAGNYNLAIDSDPPEADAEGPLEGNDIADWFANSVTQLPGGDASISCDANGRCDVVVQWNDDRAEDGADTEPFEFTSQI